MLFLPSGIPLSHHKPRAAINQTEKLSLSGPGNTRLQPESCQLLLCGAANFTPVLMCLHKIDVDRTNRTESIIMNEVTTEAAVI